MIRTIITATETAPPNAPSELAHLGVCEDMVDRLEAPLAIPIVRTFRRRINEAEAGARGGTSERLNLLGRALILKTLAAAYRVEIA